MEPVTLTAIGTAIATLIGTKALEKTGDKLADKILDEGRNLLSILNKKSSSIVSRIEQADGQPLDYGQTVFELQAASTKYPEIAQAILKLEASVNKDSSSKLAQEIQQLADNLKSQQQTVVNYGKLAEEIKNVIQGGNFYGGIHIG